MSQPSSDLIAALMQRINFEKRTIRREDRAQWRFDTLREMLRRLGDPHLGYPLIHVAGSKGKGSVTAMCGAILAAAGLSVVSYTSPHVVSLKERFQVNNRPIETARLNELLAKVLAVVGPIDVQVEQQKTSDNPDGHLRRLHRPTFFEITTCVAFLLASSTSADAAVFEVGLGGRLDSTNICESDVSVITSIGLDHTEILGETIAEIAAEKAGIIKSAAPVVCGVTQADAQRVIREAAKKHSAPIHFAGEDFETVDFSVGLRGQHQQLNAALALAACKELAKKYPEAICIAPGAAKAALEKLRLIGRYQTIDDGPTTVVDIAHNHESLRTLATVLQSDDRFKSASRRVLVFGASRDKPHQAMLDAIASHFDQIVLTCADGNPRSIPAAELQKFLRGQAGGDSPANASRQGIEVTVTAKEAQDFVEREVSPDDFVCVTGSTFLVESWLKASFDNHADGGAGLTPSQRPD